MSNGFSTKWKIIFIMLEVVLIILSIIAGVIIGYDYAKSIAMDDETVIKAVYADCVSCETGTVFAKNLDVKEHIYYGEEYEFNILDAEVKDGCLILYRAHGEPVIFSLESGESK